MQEKYNIGFFLTLFEDIDKNDTLKKCIEADVSTFIKNIVLWFLHQDILNVDFLYDLIPKLFVIYDKPENPDFIKNILHTALEIPLEESWKFYYSLKPKEKIKKLFLSFAKYFSAKTNYLLISEFDLIELVELFDELRLSDADLIVRLLTQWATYPEYKKSGYGDLLFPEFLWHLFLIHMDLFSQEEFQYILNRFIYNKENYKYTIFNVNQKFSSWYGY